MAIDTNKYFFNKDLHIEVATELNALANSKGVQVSRWVNNSRGRQIVTYIVHRGERADRAVDQADVVLILVGHEKFRSLSIPQEKTIVDTVGFLRVRNG